MAERNRNQSQKKRKREESSTGNDADHRPAKRRKLDQKQNGEHSETVNIKQEGSSCSAVSIKQEPLDDINAFNVFLNADQKVLVQILMDVLEQEIINKISSKILIRQLENEDAKYIKNEKLKSKIQHIHKLKSGDETIEVIELNIESKSIPSSSETLSLPSLSDSNTAVTDHENEESQELERYVLLIFVSQYTIKQFP